MTWESAGHFVAYMAVAMTNLLIDHNRSLKRRGIQVDFPIDGIPVHVQGILSPAAVDEELYISQILGRLEQ